MLKSFRKVIEKTVQKFPVFTSVFSLVLCGTLIYSNSLNGSFHLDDISYIRDNDVIKNLEGFFKLESWRNINHRPLPTFSFAVNYYFHGLETYGYHIVNVLLHIVNSIIVFALSRLILSMMAFSKNITSNKGIIISLIVSLLFLSHPMQTQTVNYIVQRMTLFSALFYFLSVYAYLKARLFSFSEFYAKASFYYVVTLVSFILAVFSKQNAITIPVVLLLVEVLFVRKSDGSFAKKYIWILSSILLLAVFYVVWGGYLPRENNFISREVYFSTQLEVVLRYIRTLFFPLSLNFDPYIELSKGLMGVKELVCLLIHLLILAFGIFQYKRNKYISFGIYWFYITLSIESSFIPIRDVIFDHRVYLPSFGFFFILVLVVYSFLIKNELRLALAFVLVMIYSVKSYNRNFVWKNEQVFWEDVVGKPPVKARPYRFLGIEYMFQGKYNEALDAFDNSIKLEPERWQEHNNKAVIYIALEKYKYAIKEYSYCIRKDGLQADHYINRAEIYLNIGELENCKNDLDKVNKELETDKNTKYYTVLGKYFLQKNKLSFALENFDLALSINPYEIDALNDRGIARMRSQKFEAAVSDFCTIIQVDKTYLPAFQNRGEARFFLGDFQNSIKDLDYVLSSDKKNARAYKLRGLAFVNSGQYEKAIKDLKKAKYFGEEVDMKLIQDLSKYILENSN